MISDKFNSPAQSRNQYIVTFLLLTGAFLYYVSYIRYGLTQSDEGLVWEGLERMMRGQRWNVDFIVPYGPMRFWPLTKLFAVFGESIVLFRLYFIFVRIIGLAFMLVVARRLMPLKWAAPAMIMATLMPGLIFKGDLLLVTMALLWLMFKTWESRGNVMPLILGLATGCSMWFRVELVAPISIFSVIGLEFGHLVNPKTHLKRWYRRGLNFLGIGISVTAMLVLFPGVSNFTRIFMVGMANGFPFQGSTPIPMLSRFLGNADNKALFLMFWGALAIYVVIGGEILIRFFRDYKSTLFGYRLMVFFMGVLTAFNFVYQSNLGHILPGAAPAYILFSDSFYRLWAKQNRAIRVIAISIFSATLFLFGIYSIFLCRNSPVNSISSRLYMNVPIDSELGRVYFQNPRAEWINETVKYIRENTGKDAYVATVHEPFIISVLARRRNPLIFIPPSTKFLEFVGTDFFDLHYNSFLKSDLIVYFENPYRLETPRFDEIRIRNFDRLLYDFMATRYTVINVIGDYIILGKGEDNTGATKVFLDGWYEYKYGEFSVAGESFTKALGLGMPARFIAPLLDDIKNKMGKPGFVIKK